MERARTVSDVLVEALAFESAPGEGISPALLSKEARAVLETALKVVSNLLSPDPGSDPYGYTVDSCATLEARLDESEPEYEECYG
mgnify:CR=1 FL=1